MITHIVLVTMFAVTEEEQFFSPDRHGHDTNIISSLSSMDISPNWH
jgi:hypothetical protein